jgi:hypothetical protein
MSKSPFGVNPAPICIGINSSKNPEGIPFRREAPAFPQEHFLFGQISPAN